MTSAYSIRPAVPADAACIAVLGAHVWVHTYAKKGVTDVIARYVLTAFSSNRILALATDPDTHLLVAEAEGNLIGYLVMRFGSQYAGVSVEIETLYVHSTFLGQGIGSAMLTRARDLAMTKTGKRSIWLSVNSQNERAISFYRSRGLTQGGIVYFDLEGTKHENIVMLAPG